jgi:putative transposase
MPRFARVVVPGEPYHVTHRGNHRGDVFFCEEDREIYLAMLADASERYRLDIWAWCLMTNHVHLLVVPRERTSLALGIGKPHMRYSRRINTPRGWTGHLWANRFHSSILDGEHLWNAVRYVEQNPLRAGLVSRCEEWPWSSARAHCGLLGEERDPLLSDTSPFPGWVEDWSAWINQRLDDQSAELLRRNTATGRPTGSTEFVRLLEQQLQRELTAARRGRPRKVAALPDLTEDLFGE